MNQQKNADYESDNVKDKNNIVPFNVWSGTDYEGSIDLIIVGLTISSSSEWSSKGEKSIKIISSQNSYSHVVLHQDSCVPCNLQGSIDILNNGPSNVFLRLMEMQSYQ